MHGKKMCEGNFLNRDSLKKKQESSTPKFGETIFYWNSEKYYNVLYMLRIFLL